ncbi:MAG TPA: hypothetical protein ENJ95_04625 [Bacteroidetes bacterium]|nr:hypothetical protein [Bacteroidota bacterium]
MDSFNRKLILIATSSLALTASFGFILQRDVIVNLKTEFNKIFIENKQNKQLLQDEMALTEELKSEIIVLENKVVLLEGNIVELNKKISELKAKLQSKDQQVTKLNNKVQSLTKQINQLKRGEASNLQKIKNLANERDELLKQMEIKDRERAMIKQRLKAKKDNATNSAVAKRKLQNSIDKKKKEVLNRPTVSPFKPDNQDQVDAAPTINEEMEQIIRSRKHNRMKNILQNTKVDFKNITLKTNKNGKTIDKINGNGWRSTIIEFDLKNPDPDALMDENFIIQLFDLDNQVVVPVNEKNPGFPDSKLGSTGYKFTYENQPLNIHYFNSQKKTGTNFEVRLYYVGKDFLMPIKGGTKRIVKDGRAVHG